MTSIDAFVFLGVSFLLAFLAESMTEYILGAPIDNLPFLEKLKPHKWLLRYVSAGVGVVFALVWKIDLVAITANFLAGLAESLIPQAFAWEASKLGMVLSGLAIGRGSNFLHEWVTKFLKKPEIPGVG